MLRTGLLDSNTTFMLDSLYAYFSTMYIAVWKVETLEDDVDVYLHIFKSSALGLFH